MSSTTTMSSTTHHVVDEHLEHGHGWHGWDGGLVRHADAGGRRQPGQRIRRHARSHGHDALLHRPRRCDEPAARRRLLGARRRQRHDADGRAGRRAVRLPLGHLQQHRRHDALRRRPGRGHHAPERQPDRRRHRRGRDLRPAGRRWDADHPHGQRGLGPAQRRGGLHEQRRRRLLHRPQPDERQGRRLHAPRSAAPRRPPPCSRAHRWSIRAASRSRRTARSTSPTRSAPAGKSSPSRAARAPSSCGGLRVGFPSGIALSLDDKSVFVSTLDPVKATDVLLQIDIATPTTTTAITTNVATNTDAAGLHRARKVDVYAWADSAAGSAGGTVYTVK